MATIILRLHPAESPDSELDGREGHEGGQGLGKVLEVLGEAAISPEPREGALDHPATRDDRETVHVVAPLDDLHA